MQQMLDFVEFKQQMAPRHAEEIGKLVEKRYELAETEAQVTEEDNKRIQM